MVNTSEICKICSKPVHIIELNGRLFFHCNNCYISYYAEKIPEEINLQMGMEGSWTGPGGGGYRELFLAKMLKYTLGKKSILLYGTGNTATLESLLQEGFYVTGADISTDVVKYKKEKFGQDRFYLPEEIPENKKFDAIIAVEVIEHFVIPHESMSFLMKHLEPGGIICGTTDFYFPIDKVMDPVGYMKGNHYTYWSFDSLSILIGDYGYELSLFEMVRPGSVLPDEKFNKLWPNKRVFFIYDPNYHKEYFEALQKHIPILPIDKP